MVRDEPSILHLDLDAFFAAVEQRDKPSLRGRPVVVGGLGPRGVVSTASYEARVYGVHSAMSMGEARRRCPQAAFLAPRFAAYREASGIAMDLLRLLSPRVEQLSIDEAYVDLAESGRRPLDRDGVAAVGAEVKRRIHGATGLTASVGAGTSKLIAKIASDLRKPDGLVVVPPGDERDLLRPMQVTRIPGVGKATADRLAGAGVRTIAELERLSSGELTGLLGTAHGGGLYRLARAEDDRIVTPERESKSISVEDTFDRDVTDPAFLRSTSDRMAAKVTERMVHAGLAARTVTVKVRLFDFSTHTRSYTLPAATDEPSVVARIARQLLGEVDTSDGVRLLGVGVAGLVAYGAQPELWLDETTVADATAEETATVPRLSTGADVEHAEHGHGWVVQADAARVVVRFETRATGPGRTLTLRRDDPALTVSSALPA
ncbi:MAG: DNA polymerase IV [Streptosporangiales bacterium]|nr:DNA polymerase IV [Streptosporangiales bacterium]MBO0889461.1 DNA polymerase IV [Acidothermales bacterium]